MSNNNNNEEEMKRETWDKLWERTILTSGFRKVFPGFDKTIHTYYRRKINRLLRKVDLAGGRVLELGCGSGMNSVNLFKDHSIQKANLVDFSKQALSIARENTRGYNVELIWADIFKLVLDETFDLVFSIGLIEHFFGKKREEALRFHRKFAKQNGLIMIIVPRKCFFSKVIGLVNKIQDIKEQPFSDAELARLFEKNRLKVVEKEKMIFGALSCCLLRPN